MFGRRVRSWQPADFPNLTYGADRNHRITSCARNGYNCIAWAADDPLNWWWPNCGEYWPTVPEEETLQAFVIAFESRNFAVCANGTPERGYEKVAIYTYKGVPTHAARQLRSGKWTSKLGPFEDISHKTPLDVGDGPPPDSYGRPEVYLRRKRRFIYRLRRYCRLMRRVLMDRGLI